MSFCDSVSVLILTYNEAPNIGRTLEALEAFSDIVVLDSNSTDETADIVARHRNARLVRRPFDNHAAQWNFGLTACGIDRPWVLALDADHVLPAALCREIDGLSPDDSITGYRASFHYCVHGRRLSASLYPPVITLFRREKAHYIQTGHTQRAVIDGPVMELRNAIDHDDRKPLSRWITSQQRYAKLEADHLVSLRREDLRFSDRLRLWAWPAPILVFFYTLVVKRCILDGWPGWLYVLQRTLAETMIALELVENRLKSDR